MHCDSRRLSLYEKPARFRYFPISFSFRSLPQFQFETFAFRCHVIFVTGPLRLERASGDATDVEDKLYARDSSRHNNGQFAGLGPCNLYLNKVRLKPQGKYDPRRGVRCERFMNVSQVSLNTGKRTYTIGLKCALAKTQHRAGR